MVPIGVPPGVVPWVVVFPLVEGPVVPLDVVPPGVGPPGVDPVVPPGVVPPVVIGPIVVVPVVDPPVLGPPVVGWLVGVPGVVPVGVGPVCGVMALIVVPVITLMVVPIVLIIVVGPPIPMPVLRQLSILVARASGPMSLYIPLTVLLVLMRKAECRTFTHPPLHTSPLIYMFTGLTSRRPGLVTSGKPRLRPCVKCRRSTVLLVSMLKIVTLTPLKAGRPLWKE